MIVDVRLGDTQAVKMYRGEDAVWEKQGGELPAGYTQLRYIESDVASNKYMIDTGLRVKNDTVMMANYYNVQPAMCTVIGVNDTVNRYSPGIYYGLSHYMAFGYRYGYAGDRGYASIDTSIEPPNICTIDILNKTMNVDGAVSKSEAEFLESTNNIILFAKYYGGNYMSAKLRIYGAKIYENDVLVWDAVPCLDSELIPCVYDRTGKKTVYNKYSGKFGYETMDGTYVAPI